MAAPVGQPKWVWPAYYSICAYFILTGLVGVIMTAISISRAKDGVGIFDYVSLVVGAITALIGIGLVAKVDFVRGIVNIFCWIQIVSSVLGAASLLLAGLILGPFAILMAFWRLIDAVTAGLMIFLIGETD